MKWYRKLHWQIIIGLVLGLVYGLLASQIGLNTFTEDYIKPIGTIFVHLLELIAVPLVLTSLIIGITNLSDIRKLSRMGTRTIAIYLVTTIIAISIGLLMVNLIKPGKALPEATREQLMASYQENVSQSDQSAQKVLQRKPLEPIVEIVPRNVFEAMAHNGDMLQVVFVAVLLGIGLIEVNNDKTRKVVDVIDGLNDVILRIVDFIMLLAPYGVFALIGSLIIDLAGNDLGKALELLYALGWYILTVVIGLTIHLVVTYQALFKIFSKMRFRDFLRGIRPAMLLGFSTSSSAATLPVTMDRVENNLGVHEEISSFVLPVGATVNMDGTSLYQAVAAVFIAQALGLGLGLGQQITIVVTATLASIGAAGVPGAGIIMLVIVLKAINVPIEGIGLILGVDRILDMLRTMVNITGDAAVSVAVASMENQLGALHLDD
ncbi:MAG TPA: dicarboxylate/amino acid:cation symporter [Balneolales bacterium]|nr:dicarboxylate/amino acid:cation symporter [Balneolales bacterium]